MTEPPPWPDDTFDLIFLPRFVEEIGRRAFADWTGSEARVEQQVVFLPELAWAGPRDKRYATKLLLRHTTLLARPNPQLSADELFEHCSNFWPIAQRLALPKEAAPALHRLHSVRNEIVQQSRAGKLTLKIRRVGGGPWKDYDPDWWNIDRPEDYFRTYIINPDDPFGGRPSWRENNNHWIFGPREGINQIAARLGAAPAPAPAENAPGAAQSRGRPSADAQSHPRVDRLNEPLAHVAAAASPPQADPAPLSAPKMRSRRKAVYQGSQNSRAIAVLDRIFKDKNYPTETQVIWSELWNLIREEYERYVKDNPSKLYATTSPTKKLPMPSPRTFRRALGWE
jgi:hypothetical protein